MNEERRGKNRNGRGRIMNERGGKRNGIGRNLNE